MSIKRFFHNTLNTTIIGETFLEFLKRIVHNLYENLEDMFSLYKMCVIGSNLQPHNSVPPILKDECMFLKTFVHNTPTIISTATKFLEDFL